LSNAKCDARSLFAQLGADSVYKKMFTIQGQALISGNAQGEIIFTDEPLSFWGGYSAREGKIIDTHHALYGVKVAGKIFVLPGARGSSTGSGILLEALRSGVAPAALILKQRDAILALGAVVGRELYGQSISLTLVTDADFEKLRDAKFARVHDAGVIEYQE
jgi:predicted aconitase with swiveling domain